MKVKNYNLTSHEDNIANELVVKSVGHVGSQGL